MREGLEMLHRYKRILRWEFPLQAGRGAKAPHVTGFQMEQMRH
jgi:hypothetical protein